MTQPGFPAHGVFGPPSGHYQQLGSIPPTSGPSIPPNPHRPQRSSLPLILGGAAAAFFVLAAAGGGVAFWKLRSKSVALPVDARMLPAQTSEVGTQLIEATRETDERVRGAYLAAELGSELCRPGTSDPARRIEGIGSGSPRAAKELFFNKRALEEVRSVLECGSVLGGSLDSPYQAVITVDDDKRKQRVAVGHFTITELPEKHGFTPFQFRGLPGFCRTRGDDRTGGGAFGLPGSPSSSCEETSLGAFAEGTTWFMGDRAALETMAGSVKNPKEDLNARLAALKDAAAQTEGLPVVRLQAQPKSSREFFIAPCLFGASHSAAPFTQFLDGCFPAKGQERMLEEVDSKIKAAAYETDGDVQKAGAFHGNMIFVARDDAGAKDVEADVKEIVSEWKAHIDLNDAKLINMSSDFAVTSRQKKFAAVADSYFKALKHAKVSRSGRTVRVSFKEKLSKADLAALEDADRKTVEKRRATAEILDAIQARRPVPQPALAKLVGAQWAFFLSGPAPAEAPPSVRVPMTSAECRSLQARLAPFTTTSFFTPEARLMFLMHKFASCETRPPEVDAGQRACLAAFKTSFEYARCSATDLADTVPPNQPPESEFGDRRTKKF